MALTPFPKDFNPVSFLANLRYRVSPTIYKAIEIVFKPCCVFNIQDVAYTCVSTSGTNATVNIEITLDKEVNLRGNGIYQAIFTIAGRDYIFSGTFVDGDTINITEAVIPNNSSPELSVNLIIPTNSTPRAGVISFSAPFATGTLAC